MTKVQLVDSAQARSGDKGNNIDLGLFAPDEKIYDLLIEQVTAERVKEHFKDLVKGEVIRYELPNILALKFVCKQALDGGGSTSIRVDTLGKTYSSNLLRLEVDMKE